MDSSIDNSMDAGRIAIIGMGCRIAGAETPQALWQLLAAGGEYLRPLSEQALRQAGVPDHVAHQPGYVAVSRGPADVSQFDAAFFGIAPRQAASMDPQQRVFLECCHEAFEDAGYVPGSAAGSVGVFAASAASTYLLNNLLGHDAAPLNQQLYDQAYGNDKDYLATTVSYRLDLQGPSFSINSACSSVLVAAAQACASLLGMECDMALAGGVRLEVPGNTGYVHRAGSILSPDGRCFAFDARAAGIAFGDGAGVLLLKRLGDALADGDHIYATIDGYAVANDGGAKAGFAAPGVQGQAAAISEAQAFAGVQPQQVSYMEAHGAGTAVGDAVEFAALEQVMPRPPDGQAYCTLGTVKANVGHLNTAAGAASLIKVAKMLEHRQLPPQINFDQPNPALSLAGSAFHVTRELQAWQQAPGQRRAGVNGFGIGGTNAHLILREAPAPAPRAGAATATGPYLLVLSARSPAALQAQRTRLADHLQAQPQLPLADVAYTLQTGRRQHACRYAALCWDLPSALAALSGQPPAAAPASAAWQSYAAAAQRWMAGEDIDWQRLHPGRLGRRVSLPTYPFERARHWIAPAHSGPAAQRMDDVAQWTSVPLWRQWSALPTAADGAARAILLFEAAGPSALADQLRAAGHSVLCVRPAAAFAASADGYQLCPDQGEDWRQLGQALRQRALDLRQLVCSWSLPAASVAGAAASEALLARDLAWLLQLAQWLRSMPWAPPAELVLLTRQACALDHAETPWPAQAALLGALRALDSEALGLACRAIDLPAGMAAAPPQLLRALETPAAPLLQALRHGRSWQQVLQAAPLPASAAPHGGTYLITGAAGGLGRVLARHLAQQPHTRLVLLRRHQAPAAHPDWPEFLRQLERMGAQVLDLCADMARADEVEAALTLAKADFGKLDGVFHLAGVAGASLLEQLSAAQLAATLAPKTQGVAHLAAHLAPLQPGFVLLFSSLAAVLGGPAQFADAAANAYLDAFAQAQHGHAACRWTAVNWDTWAESGMAARAQLPAQLQPLLQQALAAGIRDAEGLALCDRLLDSVLPARLIVSTRPPSARQPARPNGAPAKPRPPLEQAYAPPQGDVEQRLAALWAQQLGYAELGRHDRYAALGGDSLQATRVVAAINASFGTDISVRDFLESRDIAELACLLQALAIGHTPAPAGLLEQEW